MTDLEPYIAKFRYLDNHQRGMPGRVSFERQIMAKWQDDADQQATEIAQSGKPSIVISVEKIETKPNYGDEACFKYKFGSELRVRRRTGTKGDDVVLSLENGQKDKVAIILNPKAFKALAQWGGFRDKLEIELKDAYPERTEKVKKDIEHAQEIIKSVAKRHSIDVQLLRSNSRVRKIVAARREVAYKISKQTSLSTLKIGKLLKVDHATVINSRRAYEKNSNRAKSPESDGVLCVK